MAHRLLTWPGTHERPDGTGYYRGLDASQLCTSSRILTVADMYEVISAVGPYRKGPSQAEVHEIIGKGLGKATDPRVYDALCSFLNRTGYKTMSLAA